MHPRWLYLRNSAGDGPQFFPKLKAHRVDLVQQYEADRLDWSPYVGVMVSMHADQRHLNEHREKLDTYLETGGTIIINGHVTQPYLPELGRYEPMPKRGLKELVIHREAEHPVFEGFDSDSLTFRRGVAGFYGRGTNPAPEGALVINSAGPDHVAVDWLYERPSGGRVFVHSGVEMWMFLMREPPEPLRYIQRFFDWFAQTSRKVS